jgi:urease accessory protein
MLRLTVVLLIAMAAPAAAHTGPGAHNILSGLIHPLTGIDHVMAMLAVGAWSGLIGGVRLWAWPAAFVTAMIAGALMGNAGTALPLVEQGIAASLVVIGLLLALAVRAPTALGLFLVAGFAVFHGHAHGSEAGDASFVPFIAGFVVATTALHLTGIGLATGLMHMFNALPVRLIGAVTAATGVALLVK